MGKIEFEHGLELEHGEGGEYILRFRTPKIKIFPDPTRGHLKQARKEVLLAVRSLIDEAIEGEKKGEG
ncbi:MAG: hypothetical protein KAW00_07355 [Dehalococcoidia bacterium]|nr:hypothetical protein [Dehalococcoidia bacterium]MCK4388575.1 hypothetical protein [Dehalococcoidia bacterium]